MRMMKKKSCTLLMVEDNPGDIRLVQESLTETKILINLEVAKDGQEALVMLGLSNSSASVKPDLVLLDLNLPILNGKQVLRSMKQSAETRLIPVVVFSTSSADKDILESYDNHANCYITKPTTLDEYLSVIPEIFSFWMSTVQLPV
jgi:two-component system, chemotaxis family, response regulator Rcp1